MLSKNKIKLINSLALKKNRKIHNLFIAEGNKIVQDLLESNLIVKEIYYTKDADFTSRNLLKTKNYLAEPNDLKKVSQLKTSPGIMAIVEIPEYKLNIEELKNSLTIAFDNIQDPGNLGTIIRIANWFGIENIICSKESVDVYNPKVIQATMGSFSGVKIHYENLEIVLNQAIKMNIPVYGTFLEGENIYSKKLTKNGLIVLGNESKGISDALEKIIPLKINIPSFNKENSKTDSLNVAIATSLACSEFRRRI
jgi:RNA methyltransferase, TrmH family